MNRRRMTSGNQTASAEIGIRHELRTGDLGRIIALHGIAYDSLGGFGLKFEAYVARTIAEYFLDNDSNGRIWLAERDEQLLGCAAIVKRGEDQGQLRWVLVDSSLRGVGLGRRLVETGLHYCIAEGLRRVFLETTTGLPESMSLYDKLGFTTVAEEIVELWDGPGSLITMQLQLPDNPAGNA